MAAKHNITLAIEGTLLKRARALAARRGLSVSALLADELRALVAEDAAYASAERTAANISGTDSRRQSSCSRRLIYGS